MTILNRGRVDYYPRLLIYQCFSKTVMFLYLLGLVIFYYLYRWFREIPRVPDRGNKYVYITGCDSGFGNLLARHLDQRGFSVIASCFTEKGEEDLRKACSDRLTTLHLDVRKNESIDKAAALIKDRVGTKGHFRKLLPLLNYQTRFLSNLPLPVEKLMKEKLVKMFDPDLMKVVSCMEHAVAAVRPRTRYSPGWDANFFWLPLSYMPTMFANWILLKAPILPAKAIN
ncbi:LOW QUALITY PROTEIN: 17-beta-hydroxysteroid dehydrogenase type 6 [Esox lucius]|uniref:LOW QUALITY PROTEIN: 17-beta-hydroxysteroid dehydrogenase type 6 n=1 Tax=Esox lucius TaxID=8010 RepID=UPI0014769C45|nr:LOW QUALITY PROTEIN: 17-beta-hydroxysteroid dehydrogenase type 6 [Esox lucius]